MKELPKNMAIVEKDYFSIMGEMVDEVIDNYKKDSTSTDNEILNELMAIKMYLSFSKAKKQSIKFEQKLIGRVPKLTDEELENTPLSHPVLGERKSYYQRHRDLILKELKQCGMVH